MRKGGNMSLVKKVLMSLLLAVCVLSFSSQTYAATIYMKKEITLSPGEKVKSSAPVYLYPGQVLGIYVDEKNDTEVGFAWAVKDSNGYVIEYGNGDANFRTGAPVGEYRLYLYCDYDHCDAKGIISTQSP